MMRLDCRTYKAAADCDAYSSVFLGSDEYPLFCELLSVTSGQARKHISVSQLACNQGGTPASEMPRLWIREGRVGNFLGAERRNPEFASDCGERCREP